MTTNMNPQGATEFEPSIEWVNEDDCDILLLYLPGFLKEHLRVQLRSRTLIISGQNRLKDNTWAVFRKEFPVADHFNLDKLSAKFEGSILYVKLPKLITQVAKQDEKTPTNPPPAVPEKPMNEPKLHQPENAMNEPKLHQPENAMNEPKSHQPENPMNEPKLHQEEAKVKPDSETTSATQPNGKHDVRKDDDSVNEKDAGKDGELKGVSENVPKKKDEGGSSSRVVMKLKPWRKDVIKVLVVVVGIVVGVYWTKLIKSWIG
ncbi:hypothetical protein QVD17_19616 [Tagetes erecta]|uniref:SHSP domain-containing protein n=1 Tax=Tagetes erecta TaxID=13708 RepID=A0AAD8NQ97_TARER|nr:hypothetical protein QVD17_19616 [Tagetes erecta]